MGKNKKSEVVIGFFDNKLAFACGCGCDSNFDCFKTLAPVVQIPTVKISAKKQVTKPVPVVVAENNNYAFGGTLVKKNPVTLDGYSHHSKRILAKHHRETIRRAA